MKFQTGIICFLILFHSISCTSKCISKEESKLELWYASPASKWMESLPVGNGRLGAMIFGGIQEDVVALNESSMWSGEYDPNQEISFGKDRLMELRQLFFQGKLEEGNRVASEYLKGNPHSFGTHLPVGDLIIRFHPEHVQEVKNYRRSLDLETAVVNVSYKAGDVCYTREYISSNPDDVLAINMLADKKRSVSFDLSLNLLRDAEIRTENNQLIFEGQALFPEQGNGGVFFEGRILVKVENGTIFSADDNISIKNADKASILVDIRTNYKNDNYRDLCRQTIKNTSLKEFDALKEIHIRDYKNLFERVKLTLGEVTKSDYATDVRLKNVQNGKPDAGLVALFFQYARYLTIASSRHNSPLPIALQGFFNDNLACNMGWTNDYHLDINTQQNYWLTNLGNLSECNIPLFNYIADLAHHGAKTASVVYGSKGWTAHTTANIWGYTAPSANIAWGLFPTASSWIASHLWAHYEYTRDDVFLKEIAYPLLKGNAEFLLDYMVMDPNSGYLMTGPGISPENSFLYNNTALAASMMPTCDRVLAYEIFQSCIKTSEILNVDVQFADSLRMAIKKLPPFRLRENGALQEWYEDFEEAQPNHRHTTHLLAFYPFSQITLNQTPELAEGVRKTIENRLNSKDWEDTEWSRANMISLYARLKDQNAAYNSVIGLMQDFVRGNLLTVSPAGIAGAEEDIFIIDGNIAGAAGIGEMLVQSYNGYIEFLPCLPEEWEQGSFSGLCVRGGADVSAKWENRILENATLLSNVDNTCKIKIPNGRKYIFRVEGKEIQSNISGPIATFSLKKGQKLEIIKK